MIGTTIARRYRLLEQLGEGGMAIVYRALDVATHVEVAVKVLREELGDDAEIARRFRREAKLAGSLRSEHAVRVFDAGQSAGVTFMVMELVPGRNLDELLEAEKRMTEARAARIMIQIAYALGEAHQLGIVHRDLTPANVMINQADNGGDHVKVLDFGIAKVLDEVALSKEIQNRTDGQERLSMMSLASSRIGTPEYMSPEQARQEPVTEKTDLYGCGVLFYELLTGAPPFGGDNAMVVLLSHAEEEPLPLGELLADTHAHLADLVKRLLAKMPGERPASALALATQLEQMLPELSHTLRIARKPSVFLEDMGTEEDPTLPFRRI